MACQKDDRHIVLGHTAKPVKTFQDIPTRRLLVEQYLAMDLAEQLSLLGNEKLGELLGVLVWRSSDIVTEDWHSGLPPRRE